MITAITSDDMMRLRLSPPSALGLVRTSPSVAPNGRVRTYAAQNSTLLGRQRLRFFQRSAGCVCNSLRSGTRRLVRCRRHPDVDASNRYLSGSDSQVGSRCRNEEVDKARHQIEPQRRDVANAPALQKLVRQFSWTLNQRAQSRGEAAVPTGKFRNSIDCQLTHTRIRWEVALPTRRAEQAGKRRATVETEGGMSLDQRRSLAKPVLVTHDVRLAVIRDDGNSSVFAHWSTSPRP